MFSTPGCFRLISSPGVGFLCVVSHLKAFVKYWLPLVLWMSLIFGASADTGSSVRSSRIIGPVVRWFFPKISEPALDAVVFYARKGAHVTVYCVFAMLLWRALRRQAWNDPRPWNARLAALVIGLSFLYALSDEMHQHFVPNREGRFHDVLIDTAGAALGLFIMWLFAEWQRRRRNVTSFADAITRSTAP